MSCIPPQLEVLPNTAKALSDDWATHPLAFTIRSATTNGLRSRAKVLVQRRYAWRGYGKEEEYAESEMNDPTAIASDGSQKATLVAVKEGHVVGTLTVGFEGDGFAAESIFKDEIDDIRSRLGYSLCEFTSLAVDDPRLSKEVLATLFQTAYIWAFKIQRVRAVLIEVNPRHVGFYQTILSFVPIGEPKMNLKVNAPSVLMMLDFESVQTVLNRILSGDLSEVPRRSYYPFFFNSEEEKGIVNRLLRDPKVMGSRVLTEENEVAVKSALVAAMDAFDPSGMQELADSLHEKQ